MTESRGIGVPLGGAGLTVDGYLDFVAKEYLGDYLRAGGGVVRFVVAGDGDVARRWRTGLGRAADAEGYLRVSLDAADTRLHMIDQVFAAVARHVGWADLAKAQVRAAWDAIGLPAADELSAAAVARHHDLDPREAARSVRRQLETSLLRDATLSREFRLAALRLCQAELGTGDVADDERAAVVAWLCAEPVPLRLLRSASLRSRIGRHNARGMLVSLVAWRARVLGSGLVLDLDVGRFAITRRPPLGERRGIYYTKAAVLDAYEVLRQFVDATDDLHSAFVTITMPPELITDESRGLPAYAALQLRILDEVRDRRRANPYAALVRLETRLEAVR